MGNGAAAWAALKERFAGNTKDCRRVLREQLHASELRHGQYVIDYLATMDDLRLRLEDVGESTPKETFVDLVFLRDMHYRQPFPDVAEIRRTAVNYFIDAQSRKSSGPAVSGGGVVRAATNKDRCRHCNEYGHFQRACPNGQEDPVEAGKSR